MTIKRPLVPNFIISLHFTLSKSFIISDLKYYNSSKCFIRFSVSETTHVNGKGAGCFTGDSTVTLDNHKTINITDLNIGDKVLTLNTITGEMEYSEVLLFLHRDPNLVHNFVQITTESGSLIKMTPSHLILRWHRPNAKSILNDIEYTYAERVRVNDSIIVHKNGKAYVERVTRLENVIQTGVYAPLTTSGTIVVNNVFASCYAVIDNQFLAHLSFIPVRLYHSLVNLFSSNHIENSSHVTGIHWYPKLLYSMSDYFIPSAWMNND
jgi:Hint module.